MNTASDIKLAIFASGRGTNAENIIKYFQNSSHIKISVIFSNNPKSGVFTFAPLYKIPVVLMSKEQYHDGKWIIDILDQYGVGLIVLAGYLKKIPAEVVHHFPQKIINVHPALLPLYGGKGMYGINVHQAVRDAGDQFSGISIHYVDEIYDNGEIICQHKIEVDPLWSAQELADAIHKLEYEFYPAVIEKVCQKTLS